jgi:hypothetical protein
MNYRTFLVGALAAVSAPTSFSAVDASPRVVQSPFACDRLALTPALRHRHFDVLGPLLRTKVLGIRAEPDGYTFRFPNDWATYADLTEWMNGERLCCPFFDFDLSVAREHGEIRMKLSGRPGTKDFIRSDFAPWFARTGVRG